MYCINKIPGVRPGGDRGVAILVGGKMRGKYGPMLAKVLVPFMKVESPYEELKDLLQRIWEWWDENGKTRERVGELIDRVGGVCECCRRPHRMLNVAHLSHDPADRRQRQVQFNRRLRRPAGTGPPLISGSSGLI